MLEKFIVIDGIDGCGKSSMIKLLSTKLRTKGKKVLTLAEPSQGEIGKLLRNYYLKQPIEKSNYKVDALVFIADRLEQLNDIIIPQIRQNDYVILDRYVGSTIAYQTTSMICEYFEEQNRMDWKLFLEEYGIYEYIEKNDELRLKIEGFVTWLRKINDFALKCDQMYILNIDSNIAIKRKAMQTQTKEKFEDVEFLYIVNYIFFNQQIPVFNFKDNFAKKCVNFNGIEPLERNLEKILKEMGEWQ